MEGKKFVALPNNPGNGTIVDYEEIVDGKPQAASLDLVETLISVMRKAGRQVEHNADWLTDTASGFVFLPQIIGGKPGGPDSFLSSISIQANHPELVPDGIFEFQHSLGRDFKDSIIGGFEQWMTSDFATLVAATQEKPELLFLVAEEQKRRALFGPVSRIGYGDPAEYEAAMQADPEHPFCECCLFSKNLEAFAGLFHTDDFIGLRLFAGRDSNGAPMSDCRVNGENYPAGAEALLEYAKTWPGTAMETRKQYVVLQTLG